MLTESESVIFNSGC